jgi:hypothetical protein
LKSIGICEKMSVFVFLKLRKKEKQTRKPPVLRPKSERDKLLQTAIFAEGIRASGRRRIEDCQLRKGMGGFEKKVVTKCCFCPKISSEYYGITEETIRCWGMGIMTGKKRFGNFNGCL